MARALGTARQTGDRRKELALLANLGVVAAPARFETHLDEALLVDGRISLIDGGATHHMRVRLGPGGRADRVKSRGR